MTYIVAFSLALLLCGLSLYDCKGRFWRNKPSLPLFCASAAVLVAVLGLREGVGTDFYDVYVAGFNSIAAGESSRFEIGFYFLNWVVAALGGGYQIMFFIAALLTVSLVYVAIYRQSSKPLLSVLLFMIGGLFFFATNGIRQALAIAILLNAIAYIKAGKPIHYLAFALVASSFHLSALIFLPLYLFGKWRPESTKTVVLFLLCTVLAGPITWIALNGASLFSTQIATYMSVEHLSSQFLSSGNIDYSDLLLCMFPLAIYYIVRDKVEDTVAFQESGIYFFLLLLGVIVCVFSGQITIFSRVAAYFTPFCILAIPQLFSAMDEARLRRAWIYKGVYLLFSVASTTYLFGYLNFSHVLPYVSILSSAVGF